MVECTSSIRTYVRMKNAIRTYTGYIRTNTKLHSDICPFDNKIIFLFIQCQHFEVSLGQLIKNSKQCGENHEHQRPKTFYSVHEGNHQSRKIITVE